ncbi:MAG TPA: 23S rRNA (adenine(2503)-C(2))-methyltransferase RlmN [Egicoccus sp.]|nr:23S rRNA (adenine(2503)-C(2))-methyltransferase RlmN [Egicoccus sp.]HSK23557.1 23S rRNA (adenine(2503)-C(2))-methyltransferase RlmN [Egicoccus sp.]
MSQTAPAIDPYALTRDELAALMVDLGEPAYRAEQLHAWLVRGVDDPTQMTNLPTVLRERLAGRFADSRPELIAHTVADDGHTHKLLLRYPDGEAIETVLMLYPKRATVCISTQAGCAMGCPFCATGQAGFRRQLTAGEVIRQVVVADAALRSGAINGEQMPSGAPDHVTNVVFMGMGEPLANLPATVATVQWLHDPEGFNLSARSITVSTVGLVPGIRRLAELGLPLTLAVSLHAATDDLRDELVPVNRSHPLAEVEAVVREYRERTNRRVSIEWCLIGDVNDADEQADRLAAIARRLRAHVNVIPMNPTPGVRWKEPSKRRTRAFVDRVARGGVEITLRDTRGRDADAACGQLLASYTLGAGTRLPASVGAAERVDLLQLDPTAGGRRSGGGGAVVGVPGTEADPGDRK